MLAVMQADFFGEKSNMSILEIKSANNSAKFHLFNHRQQAVEYSVPKTCLKECIPNRNFSAPSLTTHYVTAANMNCNCRQYSLCM